MDISKFIALLFLSREYAHREHLRIRGPGSYAAHMALGSFYEEIIDLADSLTEMYQGRNGVIAEIPYLRNSFDMTEKPANVLKSILKTLEDSRYTAVSKEETSMQNEIDTIVGLFLSTIYKLENLQ